MNEREIASTGDEFKARVRETFDFLVRDFGFEPAVDESGTYAHRLTLRNDSRGQLVEIVNAFHGNDYGFEVSIQRAFGPRLLDDRNMVYFKFKEEQKPDFGFLREAAERLQVFLESENAA